MPGNSYTGPINFGPVVLCECNTVVYSLLSACGACQGGKWITCDHIGSFFSIPSGLCSVISWPEYTTYCTETLHASQSVPCGLRKSLAITSLFSPRFPNPVPSQIRVPLWSLIDVTIRYLTFLQWYRNNNTHRKRALGTLANHVLSVVSIPSLVFSFPLVTTGRPIFLYRHSRARSWLDSRSLECLPHSHVFFCSNALTPQY